MWYGLLILAALTVLYPQAVILFFTVTLGVMLGIICLAMLLAAAVDMLTGK